MTEWSWIDMNGVSFRNNTVLDRGLISTHHYSYFKLVSSEFIDNEGMWDAALVEIDGPRWLRYHVPNPDQSSVIDNKGYYFLDFSMQ
jgi:hypothetical protein